VIIVLIFVGMALYALFFLQNSINNSSVPMPKRAYVDASGIGVVVNDKGGADRSDSGSVQRILHF
jgi:hypothetical protein